VAVSHEKQSVQAASFLCMEYRQNAFFFSARVFVPQSMSFVINKTIPVVFLSNMYKCVT